MTPRVSNARWSRWTARTRWPRPARRPVRARSCSTASPDRRGPLVGARSSRHGVADLQVLDEPAQRREDPRRDDGDADGAQHDAGRRLAVAAEPPAALL